MGVVRLVPFDYIDKLCLAGTLAPAASCAPTWRLYIRGRIDEQALRVAVAGVLARYPTLAARVVPLGGTMERARRFAWALDETPEVERALVVADLRAAPAEERARLEQSFIDHFLDVGSTYPFLVTWVRLPSEGGRERSALFLQQHHAVADGRAFLLVCRDLVRLLDCTGRGIEPPPPDAPFAKKMDLDVIRERGLARAAAFLRGLGHVLYSGVRGQMAPPTPLACNVGRDWTGKDRTRFVLVPAARVEAWREARTRLGLSGNDVLTAALAAALGRWSAAHGAPPGRTRFHIIVDTRPRGEPFHSFANHLSSFFLSVDLGRAPPVLELARRLAAQARAQARAGLPHKKLLVEAPLIRAMPIHWLRREIFGKRPRIVANYTFSNLIALGIPGADRDGRWRGAGFEVDALRITTPCSPPQGANTTVVNYGGELCFNFNFKDSAVSEEAMRDLCARFEEALDEMGRALGERVLDQPATTLMGLPA